MNSSVRWTMVIHWSDEDDAFLVTLPEWDHRVANPVTHGATYEEAVANGREVLEMLAESSVEHGEPLPVIDQPTKAA